ncbi:MAG: hypothetical protein LUD68_00745 [Rikenellaceae bacterium]|nr:hypothetical protein [Rikenellaceae bacterium]
MSLSGEITSNSSNNILGINLAIPGSSSASNPQNSVTPIYNQPLGSWNIESTPVVWTTDTLWPDDIPDHEIDENGKIYIGP